MKIRNIYGKPINVDGIKVEIDQEITFDKSMEKDQGIKNLIKNKYIEIVKPTKK